jgi:glycosyltransferase involved in cell wall biosynthesis
MLTAGSMLVMDNPLVSVKMLTYNHAPYISRAIEGVINQKTCYPFELVIGEDFSTDGTREIVHDYQKRFPDIIRVITSEQNVGVKKNNKRTTDACRGKYITICEGDDYWHHPEKIQMQAEYLEDHPDCGLVYTSFDVLHIKPEKRINDYLKYRKFNIPEDIDISSIVNYFHVSAGIMTCTVMIDRATVNLVRDADPYLHMSPAFLMGDIQMWAEISIHKKVHYIPKSTATYVISPSSMTRNRDVVKQARFNLSAAKIYLYLCQKHKLGGSEFNKFYDHFLRSKLQFAYLTHDPLMAKKVKKQMVKMSIAHNIWYLGAHNKLLYALFEVILKPYRAYKIYRRWR